MKNPTDKNTPKKDANSIIVMPPESNIYSVKFAQITPAFVSDIWQNLGEKKCGTRQNDNQNDKPIEREKLTLIVTSNDNPDLKHEFYCYETLSGYDLWTYQTIVGMAPIASPCKGKLLIKPETISPTGLEHRESIELKFEAVQKQIAMIRSTFPEFAHEMGYAPGSCRSKKIHTLIMESFERLYKTTIIIRNTGPNPSKAGFRLVSHYQTHESNTFSVAINPTALETLFGDSWNQHDFEVIRNIKNEGTRLIHAHLCKRHNIGEPLRYSWNTLLRYAYPPRPTGLENEQMELIPINQMIDQKEKKRLQNFINNRKRIIKRTCLSELERTGHWKIAEEGKKIVIITRLK